MKVLIIGGGASGMMAALVAAQDAGNRVTLLERQARVGRKLLASGNGRCNLSNLAADELTGLIWSAALMRPSKSVQDMELKSLKKKYKDKKFAAGCSRDVIQTGAERLGWELDTLLERTILAMRSCEESVAAELAALGLA